MIQLIILGQWKWLNTFQKIVTPKVIQERISLACKVLGNSLIFVRCSCFAAATFRQCTETMCSERSLCAVQLFFMTLYISFLDEWKTFSQKFYICIIYLLVLELSPGKCVCCRIFFLKSLVHISFTYIFYTIHRKFSENLKSLTCFWPLSLHITSMHRLEVTVVKITLNKSWRLAKCVAKKLLHLLNFFDDPVNHTIV